MTCRVSPNSHGLEFGNDLVCMEEIGKPNRNGRKCPTSGKISLSADGTELNMFDRHCLIRDCVLLQEKAVFSIKRSTWLLQQHVFVDE